MSKPDFIYPKIRLACPGVPSLIMDGYIVSVTREVCTRTMANVEYLNVPLVAGDNRYNLNTLLDSYTEENGGPPEEVFGIRNRSATLLNEEGNEVGVIKPTTEDDVSSKSQNYSTRSGTPSHCYFDISAHQLRVWPTPSKNGTLKDLVVVVRPKRNVLEANLDSAVPLGILNAYEELIATGVIGELMRIPKMPWSNFTVGQRLYKDYKLRLGEVRRDVRTSHVRAKRQGQLPNFT